MDDANNYAFWYAGNNKTQDSNNGGENVVVNDLHSDFESFENFTNNIPGFSDDIVSAFEVNQAMETMNEDNHLFSELDIFNSITPRKSDPQDNSNGMPVTPEANHMNGDSIYNDTTTTKVASPKTVAETVGMQSIKQLLQSPPQFNGSDGENMMKKTTSFVCSKSEEIDDKDMPFPVVQDIKPPSTATINIPCTSVIKNSPIQIIQSTSPQSVPSTTLQTNYSQSTPTLQTLLMTPKVVQQPNGQHQQQQNGQQQFIITTTKGNQQIIQQIQTPIQVTSATNVQLSQGGAISVIQPNTAVFQQRNSPQQQKQIFTTASPQQQSTIGTGITTIQTNSPNHHLDSSPRSNFGSSPNSNQGQVIVVSNNTKFPIERVSPPTLANNNNKQPKVNKTQRSAHNAIEKRYRASINKRISELHELLCPGGSDSKLSKAAILEKAIRQIKFLQQMNNRLKTENIWLRKVTSTVENVPGKMIAEQPQSMMTSPDLDDVTMMHEMMMGCDGIPSPPNSTDSGPDSPNSLNNDSDYLASMNGVSPNVQQQQQQTININTRHPMHDNKKFVLCLFTLFCVTCDPINRMFGSLFGAAAGSQGGAANTAAASGGHIGRIILGYGSLSSSSGWLDWMFPTLLTWCLNGTICIVSLLQLLVWGEPVTEEDSKAHQKYRELRQNANDEMRKGKHESAAEIYHSCLETLGRPMPVSKLDKIACVSWNIFRFFLSLMKISPFMARKMSRDPSNVQLSARLAAQIYHRLDQLNMTGKMKYSCLDGFIYSLSSMNLCEVAGWELTPPDIAVRIYATAALRAKKVLPKFLLKWVSWYFINRSQRVLSTYSNECDDELKWLSEPDGQQFLIDDDNWNYDSETESESHVEFSTISDKEDPISHAAFHFRKHLLQKSLYSLVMPVVFSEAERKKGSTTNSNKKKKRRQPPAATALQYLQLVAQCEEDEFDEEEDEAESKFWLSVATVAAHYAMGDDKSADEYSQIIQQLPLSLELSKNELPRTVSWAFVAFRDMLSLAANNEDDDVTMNNNNEDAARHCDVLQMCNKSSRSLRDNLLNRSNNKQIPMFFRLIACEWLLKTRTLLWEHTQCHDGVTRRATYEQLTAFECDVTLLRAIVHDQPSLYPKVCIYEATARMMAGASPVQTEMLLNSVIRRRRPPISNDRGSMELEVGEYERAYANILACKHLSSPMLSAPGQRNSMLKDASHMMELLGDERSVKTATNMLKKLGCNDTTNDE